MLTLWFVYMSVGLQIFMCHHYHLQHLMAAVDFTQITISIRILSNCSCS